MPKKSKSATRPARTRAKRVSTNKNKNFLTKLWANKPALLIILAVTLVGVLLLFRAGAASSNFEAESASPSGGARVISNDSSASGSKYVQFSSSATSSTTIRRFPGDPNPKITNKAYWGSTIGGNGNPKPRHEDPTGKSLSIRRTFFSWNHIDSGAIVNMARADHQNNRLPFVSFKTPHWSEFKPGDNRHNATLDKLLRELDQLGKPVWLVAYHEPENDPQDGTPAQWRDLQRRVRERMNALGTKNIAFMPVLMDWTWDSRSGRNPNDWWVDNIWDAVLVDPYRDSPGTNILDNTGLKNFIPWIENKGLPFGTAEWGIRTVPGGNYIAQSETPHANSNSAYCAAVDSGQFLKNTTEQQEAAAKKAMRDLWEWGFANKKDWIAHTYFDTCINSASGPWRLGKGQLEQFQAIMRDDNRVQRINDLDTSTSSSVNTYGTITANVSIPANSTYKVWVRMNAADNTNNALQLQIDNSTIIKVGDSNVPANAWTWVDWKDGNVNSKTTMPISAGTRKVTITGIEPGIKVDRVIITDENCVPTGFGDNCTIVAPAPNPNPSTGTNLNVNIVSPLSGQTVSNTTRIRVEPATNVKEVSFRINGVWQTTDDTAPFEWDWDTTKFPNGQTAVTIRARADGDPGGKYTEKSVNVVVNNSGTVSTPPPPPTDTIAPTKPTNLTANLRFDPTKFRYVFDLKWTASSDNVGIAKYEVYRNGTKLGDVTSSSYVDSSSLTTNTTYKYDVIAKDARNNSSPAASITVRGSCFLIWCTSSVL